MRESAQGWDSGRNGRRDRKEENGGVVEGVHFVSLILSLPLVSSAPLPTLSIPQEKNSSSESSSSSM